MDIGECLVKDPHKTVLTYGSRRFNAPKRFKPYDIDSEFHGLYSSLINLRRVVSEGFWAENKKEREGGYGFWAENKKETGGS